MKISVFIPNYNHGHFLQKCIKKYASQEFKPFEIIISDDGSTDNSVEIINNLINFYKNDLKIILVKNIINVGIHKNVLNNYKKCKGDFIYFGSVTDGIEKIFFKKAMECIQEFPKVKLIFGDVSTIDEYDKLINYASIKKIERSSLISPKIFYKKILMSENLGFSLSTSTIYNKEIIDKFDFFNEKLGSYCDTFFINSICLSEYTYYVKENCSFWLLEEKSYSQTASILKSLRVFINTVNLMLFSQKYKSIYPKPYILKWIIIYPIKIIFHRVKRIL